MEFLPPSGRQDDRCYLQTFYLIIKKFKLGIGFSNQGIFLFSSPAFDLFFTFYGKINISEMLVKDKIMTIVLFGKTYEPWSKSNKN
jgi:hypothetical protein